MQQTTNDYLEQVLLHHRLRRSVQEERRCRHETLRFVEDHWPPGAAGTVVGEAEIQLRFPPTAVGSAQEAKASVYRAAEAAWKGEGVHVQDGRIDIGLGFLSGGKTLGVSLLPGVDGKDKVLVLYDQWKQQELPVDLDVQRSTLEAQSEWVKAPIQLLKIWKMGQTFVWPGIAVEALVVEAFVQPFTGAVLPGELLTHVLRTMIPRLQNEAVPGAVWWELLPSAGGLALASEFKSLFRALEQNDLETLKKSFPLP